MESKVKNKLKEALLVMKKKNVQNICITDLCKKAGVARATFYLHYKDIDNFICKVSDEITVKFFEQIVVIIKNDGHELYDALTERNLLLSKTDRELLGYLLSINDLISVMSGSDSSLRSKIEKLFTQKEIQDYHKDYHLEWNYFISGLIAVLYRNMIDYKEAKTKYEIFASKDIANTLFSDCSDKEND